jgi:hypothetical protein
MIEIDNENENNYSMNRYTMYGRCLRPYLHQQYRDELEFKLRPGPYS